MINKTFIINLERRKDKRTHIENQFTTFDNANYQFFSGIDGTNAVALSKHTFNIPNWCDPASKKAMTLGEIGCALSHYCLWKQIVDCEDREGKYLILEDDVIVPDDIFQKFSQYTQETSEIYDMIYLLRKPSDVVNEQKLSLHISVANRSYWLCAYVVTWEGARKLCNENYLNYLIPVDEYVPAMYGSDCFGFEKYYESHEKIKCFAITPDILKLRDDAFNDSETCHSQPYFLNSYKFDTDKEFVILYVGGTRGATHERFISYCKIYGLPYIILERAGEGSASDAELVQNEIGKWDQAAIDNTLILVVSSHPNSCCNILPLASPSQIIDLALSQMITKDDIVCHNGLCNNKVLFCGWGTRINNLISENIESIRNVPYNLNFLVVLGLSTKKNILFDEKQEIFCRVYDITNVATVVPLFNHRKSQVILNGVAPCIIYSDDIIPSLTINKIENYTGNNWNEFYGCKPADTLELDTIPDDDLPPVYISFNVRDRVENIKILDILNYPKHLLTVNFNTSHYDETFFNDDYAAFLETNCQYYFYIDDQCELKNPMVLKDLMNQNRNVIAPLIRDASTYGIYFGSASAGTESTGGASVCAPSLKKIEHCNVPYILQNPSMLKDLIKNSINGATSQNARAPPTYKTNFWGSIDDEYQHCRSFDYAAIANCEKTGRWNVPYIAHCLLIKRKIIEADPLIYSKSINMNMCERFAYNVRKMDEFMYVLNMDDYGDMGAHAQGPTVPVTLFSLLDNKTLWERKYLHKNYLRYINNLHNLSFAELCPDIFSFPLFSEDFCTELIGLTESYGRWSKGKDEHLDERLGKNYYENVPTVDVQLFEINLEEQWRKIIFTYVAPIAKILYSNYVTKDINLAFVVKYDENNQKSLEPHHDSSVYTINIALNRGNGIDYDGGGCHFIKQKYVLKNQEPGMCTIHPGRLTAYHEGLAVTWGTRYILVSFVN